MAKNDVHLIKIAIGLTEIVDNGKIPVYGAEKCEKIGGEMIQKEERFFAMVQTIH